jgi:hypothetical protein
MVSDLRRALSDIGDIRQQLAAGTLFRGFGPLVLGVTGVLALMTAAVQAIWPELAAEPASYFATWTATAVASAALVGVEMVARTRRHHGGLADAMLFNAAGHFLPVGAAGAVVAVILLLFAPDVSWLLPGIWQMLVALGLFASTRFLPGQVALGGAWYFVAGASVLMLASQTRMLSPWAMGVPFGVGQFLLAAIIHVAFEGDDEDC